MRGFSAGPPPKNRGPEAEELINREDAPILAAAMLPQVDHFVTADNHFLDNPAVKQRLGVKMLRVADMLKKLG